MLHTGPGIQAHTPPLPCSWCVSDCSNSVILPTSYQQISPIDYPDVPNGPCSTSEPATSVFQRQKRAGKQAGNRRDSELPKHHGHALRNGADPIFSHLFETGVVFESLRRYIDRCDTYINVQKGRFRWFSSTVPMTIRTGETLHHHSTTRQARTHGHEAGCARSLRVYPRDIRQHTGNERG